MAVGDSQWRPVGGVQFVWSFYAEWKLHQYLVTVRGVTLEGGPGGGADLATGRKVLQVPGAVSINIDQIQVFNGVVTDTGLT